MERVLKRVLSILKGKLRIGFSIRLRVFSFKMFFSWLFFC
ncbi:hypothetical protein LEP1GSC043_1094 [Leptospira weilii str. Ecochallenge]|uniref:Uncharacterized protein n=1 Tax=Leptospira weilii str. Ecochallenge TaxID=1049986 RepID=N1U5J7_9LEPT|nr:hypothetical protein LEP1GSC043_1094 [Leptospira weilii str. Ecochallenge]